MNGMQIIEKDNQVDRKNEGYPIQKSMQKEKPKDIQKTGENESHWQQIKHIKEGQKRRRVLLKKEYQNYH
jgi:hypothetical protein